MKRAGRLRDSNLIQGAGFFSEPVLFDALKDEVYPAILKDRAPGETIRIWMPDCCTGEEAYSQTVAIVEYLEESRCDLHVQLFGTDLSEADIQTARSGIYPESACREVGSMRLLHYFKPVKGGYQINKRFRDMCVFARQDIGNDAPFSHMDLVRYRNLSALHPDLQERVLCRLHYALKPTGFLVLGRIDSIGEARAELFANIEGNHRIFRKKKAPVTEAFWFSVDRRHAKTTNQYQGVERRARFQRPPVRLETEAERLFLAKYVPAAIIVNENLEIVHTRGNAARYLDLPPRRTSLKLLPLVRPELISTLQDALREARQEKASTRKENVAVEQDGLSGRVNLEVVPLGTSSADNNAKSFLIVFEDAGGRQAKSGKPPAEDGGEPSAVARLRRELEATKEYLQATIDLQASTNDELQATNEQILSSNEELQSANEELLSTNEELRAIKDALEEASEERNSAQDQAKRTDLQLTQAKNEIVNVPVVVLGRDFSVHHYTPAAEQALRLSPGDIGLPVTDLPTLASVPNLQALLRQVITDGGFAQQEFQHAQGSWYRLRIVPYRRGDAIDGAVLTMMDITDLKRLLGEVAAGRAKLEETFRLMQSGLVVAEVPSGKVQMANDRLWEILGDDIRSESNVLHYINHALDGDGLSVHCGRWAIARSMRGEVVYGEEIEWLRADGHHVFLAVNSSPIRDKGGNIVSVVATFVDLTYRRSAEEMLRVSEQMAATGRLAAALAHEINNPLEALTNLCYLVSTENAIPQHVRNYINIARTELNRISHISNSLLGLYRADSKTESFLVREVINDVLDVFATKIVAGKIRVVKRYEAEGEMHGCYTELRQVFLNLVGNALEAMGPSGLLTIRTSASRNWSDLSSRGFRISVADSGGGIPHELRRRLFEPFFTTKGKKGTGLGLWVSKGIVHRYGGNIRVRSRTDPRKSGTTFSIFLPNSTVKRSLKYRPNRARAALVFLPPSAGA